MNALHQHSAKGEGTAAKHDDSTSKICLHRTRKTLLERARVSRANPCGRLVFGPTVWPL